MAFPIPVSSKKPYAKLTPENFAKKAIEYRYFTEVAVGIAIIVAVGSLIAVYLSMNIVSSLASAVKRSPLLISPWVSKSALIGVPLFIGICLYCKVKKSADKLLQIVEGNTGIGHAIGIPQWPFPIHVLHTSFTKQFYTPAGADHEGDLDITEIKKGDLPSHVMIRANNLPYLKVLLELAKETLTGDQMRTYLNHANEKGETIHSLAQEKGISRELTTILNELELSDLVRDVNL